MNIKSYFAAANGYDGFRSCFDEVFDSECFEHIYVLKGGPGTGKSTFMKKISNIAKETSVDCETIYCSSDPNSLDGIILYSERGKFAILDGTSPHERDAIIPGSIDSIINIGENLDIKKLKDRRAEIIEKNHKKKEAYKSAYKNLKAAGAINERIKNIIYGSFCFEKSNLLIKSLNYEKTSKEKQGRVTLTNAFCKFGRCGLDSFKIFDEKITFFGEHGEEYIFFNILAENYKQKYNYISFDPLDRFSCDGIVIDDKAFYISNKETANILASEFLEPKFSLEEVTLLENSRNNLIDIAKKNFIEASNWHFELESIYSDAVFFEKNDELSTKIIKEIF